MRGPTARVADLASAGSQGQAAQSGTSAPTVATASPTASGVRGGPANTATGSKVAAPRSRASAAGLSCNSTKVQGYWLARPPADKVTMTAGTTTVVSAATQYPTDLRAAPTDTSDGISHCRAGRPVRTRVFPIHRPS